MAAALLAFAAWGKGPMQGARGFLLATPLAARSRCSSSSSSSSSRAAAAVALGFARPQHRVSTCGVRALAAAASEGGAKGEWPLDRVRTTFIDYFAKKRVCACFNVWCGGFMYVGMCAWIDRLDGWVASLSSPSIH